VISLLVGVPQTVENRTSVVPTAAAYYWASRIRYKTFMSFDVLGSDCFILGSSVSHIIFRLLGRYAAYMGSYSPTYQGNLSLQGQSVQRD
jgi:hypothetical protein